MTPGSFRKPGEKVRPGSILAGRTLTSITGEAVALPDPAWTVHLQFRRFAGCPVCNLHLQSFARRQGELAAAGIREVVVFHSTVRELVTHAGDLPFDVIADPEKRLYRELGVEASPRALLDPRAWLPIVRGVLHGLWAIAWRRGAVPPLIPGGGRLGLPADFLIGGDGRVLASSYGAHADDQWSVDEVLDLGRRHSAAARGAPAAAVSGTGARGRPG